MTDKNRPGGDEFAWVDSERTSPKNAFDKNDNAYGQQYTQEREAEEGARQPSGDVAGSKAVPRGSAAAGEDSFAGTADGDAD